MKKTLINLTATPAIVVSAQGTNKHTQPRKRIQVMNNMKRTIGTIATLATAVVLAAASLAGAAETPRTAHGTVVLAE